MADPPLAIDPHRYRPFRSPFRSFESVAYQRTKVPELDSCFQALGVSSVAETSTLPPYGGIPGGVEVRGYPNENPEGALETI